MITLYWALGFILAALVLGLAVGFAVAIWVMDRPVSMDAELDDMAEHGERR